MSVMSTVFVTSDVEGELFCSHLPICRLRPGQTASLPAPKDGEVVLTFLPEEGTYLPVQRRLVMVDGEATGTSDEVWSLTRWTSRLTQVRLTPPRLPLSSAVYPEVMETLDVALQGRTYQLSRIRRDGVSLLLQQDEMPLLEVPFPASCGPLTQVYAAEPSSLVAVLRNDILYAVCVLRLEPTGWQIIRREVCEEVLPTDTGCDLCLSLPDAPSCRKVFHVSSNDVTEEYLPNPKFPLDVAGCSRLLLEAIRNSQEALAASLLFPDLHVRDLAEYLGNFMKIAAPPTTLPIDSACAAWGLSGSEEPPQMRLYVFETALYEDSLRVNNIYLWE